MGRKSDKKKHMTRKQKQVINKQAESPNGSHSGPCPEGPDCPDCLDFLPYPEEFLPSASPVYHPTSSPRHDSLSTGLASIIRLTNERRKGIDSLEDIEKLVNFEFQFLDLLRQTVCDIPLSQREDYKNLYYQDYETLRGDLKIVMKWRDQQSKFHFVFKDKIAEIEKNFKPHPNFKILSVSEFHDETLLVLSEDIPEINFRIRQAFVYFTQVIDSHCRVHQEFLGEKKIFGCESAPISLYSPKTRISSRDYIFSPGSSFQSECVRYMSFFLTSVIRKNEIPPLMPYVPLNSNEPMPFSLMVNGEPIIAEYPDGIVD